MKKRVQTIFKDRENSLDAIVIKNGTQPFLDDNFFYITGLEKGIFEGTYALLYPDGTIDVITSTLEQESAKKAAATLHVYQRKEEREQILRTLLSDGQTIGVNFSGILHQDIDALHKLFPKTTFVDVSKDFMRARLVKDEEELERIRQACHIADMVMEKLPSVIHEGMHEYDVAAEIDYLLQRHGAEKPAFDTISSFGSNTAEPHYTHGDTMGKHGEFVLCDFGASYRKYNSDTTRTFVFGNATSQQKDMHATVIEAQTIGFNAIQGGIHASEVHKIVSAFIDNTKFKGCFIHSTGHSLGLAVHDGPGFSPDSEIILQENMVFTVEPGVYLPGFGGVRIEDDILVKKKGIEHLTKSSKELLEL